MKKHNNEENDLSLEQRIINMMTLDHTVNNNFGSDKVEIMLKLAEIETKKVFDDLTSNEFLLFLYQQTFDIQSIITRQLVGSVGIENKDSDLEKILIFVAAIKHLLSVRVLYYVRKEDKEKREEGAGC